MNKLASVLNCNRAILCQLYRKHYYSKIPATPINTFEKVADNKVSIDPDTLALLERLSLVQCDTDEGVKILEDSIVFANKILYIDTENVEPLFTVLEDENLSLRADKITQGNCQREILKNALVKDDDYFVAPPGNIPYEVQDENIEPTNKNEKRNL